MDSVTLNELSTETEKLLRVMLTAYNTWAKEQTLGLRANLVAFCALRALGNSTLPGKARSIEGALAPEDLDLVRRFADEIDLPGRLPEPEAKA